MNKLRWYFSPQWNAWWLVFDKNSLESQGGYGPFVNDWECKIAGDLHGVPFVEVAK
jgi:hypothetical protein